ncbi:MAG: insulinase family protein [Acidobacteriota bacterium]
MNFKRTSIIIFFILLSSILLPKEQYLDLTTSKGLNLKIVKDPDILFTHAEMVIYYTDMKNPVIPYLTFLNIFNNKINDPRSGMLNILFKLGNDIEYEYNLDHIILKINFLNEKIPLFIEFLKEFFSFKNFSLKKFNYSVKNFKHLYREINDWEIITAAQVAYEKILGNRHSGKFFITPESFKNLNLSHIRSFHKKNYSLSRANVVIRGNFNPYVIFGSVEKAFKNFKDKKNGIKKIVYNTYSNDRKVFLINRNGNITPSIYWFETIPTGNNINHHQARIINNIIFGYPIGRITRIASNSGIRNFNISTTVNNHRNISILSNKIRVSYINLEKFILIADNIINQFGAGRVGRKEYLNAYNYFYLSRKVKLDDYRYKTKQDILSSINSEKPGPPVINLNNIVKNVNFSTFNRLLSNPPGYYKFTRNKKRGVIVIVGNARTVLKNLKVLKPQIIKTY